MMMNCGPPSLMGLKGYPSVMVVSQIGVHNVTFFVFMLEIYVLVG